jgi:hypothetical protein
VQVVFGDSTSGVQSACGWFARVGYNLTYYIVPYSTACPDSLSALSTTLEDFWVPMSSTRTPSPEPPAPSNSPLPGKTVVAISVAAIGGVVLLALVGGVLFYVRWRRRQAPKADALANTGRRSFVPAAGDSEAGSNKVEQDSQRLLMLSSINSTSAPSSEFL